jgi:hypothetical protein
VHIENPLRIALVDGPPAPVGEAALVAAASTVDGLPTALPGAYVEATIRNPAGESAMYRLHDDGAGGDESAGDGIFSVVIPGPSAQQLNDVSLVLRWQGLGAVIRGQDLLAAENFPVMSVAALEPGSITHGDDVRVAVIEIHVAEYPYPVDPSALSAGLLHGDGSVVSARPLPKTWLATIERGSTTCGRRRRLRGRTRSKPGSPAAISVGSSR